MTTMWLFLTLCLAPALCLAASVKEAEIINRMKDVDAKKAADEAIKYLQHLKKSYGRHGRTLDFATDRFLGPETIFNGGGINPGQTYMGSSLSTVVDFFKLDKVQFEFENSLFGAATCTFCKASFLFLQYYLDQSLSMHEAIQDAQMMCTGVVLLSPEVCKGLIGSFGPDVYMVMMTTKQSPENICGFMFGEACDNPPNPMHEWSYSMPPPSSNAVHLRKTAKLTSNRVKRHDHHHTLTVLHISDTHWDPLYKEGSLANCRDFLCCREESGEVYDEDDKAGYWGDSRKCDTPQRTIEAMYRHIASHHPELDFIYWTGDLPAHDIWKQTRESNADIVRGTARQLRDNFPGVPVYPALGNHESYPMDSFPPPSMAAMDPDISMSWLHDVLSEEWGAWLGQAHSWSVKKGAYYSINVSPGLRVISLNMNYCMNKNLWLLINSTDPADQLRWLVYELQVAEFHGEKVHILGHIPPGHVDCVKVWSRNFDKIINRYKETVSAQFYGHTHTDEFQLFYDDKNFPVNVAYVAPSVTPYYSLNPSYRLYTVSVAGEILDTRTFVMDLKEANKHPDKDPHYYQLYSARKDYNMKDLSPLSWHKLVNRLQTDKAFFNLFYEHYNSGSVSQPCDPNCRRRLICRLVSARSHDTETLCGHLKLSDIDEEPDEDDAGWWLFG